MEECQYILVCPVIDNDCAKIYKHCIYREFKEYEEAHRLSLNGSHSQLENIIANKSKLPDLPRSDGTTWLEGLE